MCFFGNAPFFYFRKRKCILWITSTEKSFIFTGQRQNPTQVSGQQSLPSSPAVSARIERLEKAGILTGYHASINHEALGYHITAFIHMALDPKQKPTFYPFVEACPNVLECNCVTGAHSMLMKVCFPNTMDLDSFIGQLQRFGSTETQIVFSTPVPTRGVLIDTDTVDSSEAM